MMNAVGALTVLVAAGYVLTRAVSVPLTYDEAVSFIRYVAPDPGAVFDFGIAANHWLNTVLSRLFHAVIPASWSLRLPSMIAGALYLVSAVALARQARHGAVGLAGLVLLATNPYVLEYFALSRGYGLAIGLLTGSLVSLLRWLNEPIDGSAAGPRLAWALGLAAAAVAANFAVLSAFVAIVAVALLRCAWVRRRGGRVAAGVRERAIVPWPYLLALAVLTTVFSAMAFSRDRVLAQDLFTPVIVRAVGLFPEELQQIRVYRLDATGRLRELNRGAEGEWRLAAGNDAWGLQIDLPAAVDRNLAVLDVIIGSHVFRRDRRSEGPWRVRELGDQRVLVASDMLAAGRSSNPVRSGAINWEADAEHLYRVGGCSAVVLGALAGIAVVLTALSLATVRAGFLRPIEARAFVASVLAVGAVAAAPLYLLVRSNELYFGGTSGLIQDTFGSLVRQTAYGAQYHPNQEAFALAAAAMAAAGLPVLLLTSSRARREHAFEAPAVVLGVIALIAAQSAAQHALLGTPYLTGRTALFLVPLFLAFATLFADALAAFAPSVRGLVTATILTAAVASASHFLAVANVSRTLDWPDDSTTPQMLTQVVQSVSAEPQPRPPVIVGVERRFYPVARYYADRWSEDGTPIEIVVVPGDGFDPEFIYARPSMAPPRGLTVATFITTDTVLWRVRATEAPR